MDVAIIVVIVVVVGLLVFAAFFIHKANRETPIQQQQEIPDDCCGAHAVCERDSLLSKTEEIFYFDDEELDELAGISAVEFSDEQHKMIENVFFTLREQDVAGWLRSVQLRNIELPDDIREQALLIVSERRTARLENYDRKN